MKEKVNFKGISFLNIQTRPDPNKFLKPDTDLTGPRSGSDLFSKPGFTPEIYSDKKMIRIVQCTWFRT